MKEFIVQSPGRGVRTTSHKFRLSFYRKTEVSRASMDAFPFSPLKVTAFPGVVSMTEARHFHLIDCIGHVVGKEEVIDMVTRNGDASKRMGVYLEDLEGRKMKCTLFGAELVARFNHFIQKKDIEPVVMVAQLFKPNFYLEETSIQSTFHASRIFFNPDFAEVKQFRERLLSLGDIATQGIVEVPTQSQNSATSELAGGGINIDTIESILSMNEVKHCWVLGEVVSIECGSKGWYYASCRNCYKKVEDKKDVYKCGNCGQLGSKPPLKYRLNVIITDGTRCINVLLWNSEATMLLEQSARDVKDANPDIEAATYPKLFDDLLEKKYLMKLSVKKKNISNVDPVYSVIKVSEDPSFIELYSSQRSSVSISQDADLSVSDGSNGLVAIGSVDGDCAAGGCGIVSLSKDSTSESNGVDGMETPSKDKSTPFEEVGVSRMQPSPADGNGSTNKTFRRQTAKRKME